MTALLRRGNEALPLHVVPDVPAKGAKLASVLHHSMEQ